MARNPLFDVMVLLQNAGPLELDLPDIEPQPFFQEHGSSKFDLSFDFEESPAGLLLGIRYRTDLFDGRRITAMGDHFIRLIDAVLADADHPVGRLNPLSPADRRWLLERGGGPAPESTPPSIWQQVEGWARRQPGRPALRRGETELDYGRLDDLSRRLGHLLLGRGVVEEQRIGVLIDRGDESAHWLPVALLGIWRAGATFVPLDPQHPVSRLQRIIERSGCRLLLTAGTPSTALRPLLDGVETIDLTTSVTGVPAADGPFPPYRSRRTAYVIFTSGTTGEPKGVVVEHHGLNQFLAAMRSRPGCGADDRMVSVTTPSFDIFYLELFLPLISGATVILADHDRVRDGGRLAELLTGEGATLMQATPATWKLLLESEKPWPRSLRMLCGGEPMPPSLAERLLANGGELWNLYGPTETTIWSSAARIDRAEGPMAIGSPIAGTRILVLDPNLEPTPIGVPGDIHIGGAGVARGYLNDPRLTADRFVPDPLAEGQRLYRTGDEGVWTVDGRLLCLGRRDGQVKVRGFRIEIGEVEHHLLRVPGVEDGAVTVHGGEGLAAHVVGEVEMAAIQGLLSRQLPAYMVPNRLLRHEILPRTANGKLDRKALPDPLAVAVPAGAGGSEPPRDDLERQLMTLMAEILALPVAPTDSFFQLGGHSLTAMTLVSRIRRQLEVELTPADLFAVADPRGLAALIRARKPVRFVPIEAAPEADAHPASRAQRRLWVLCGDQRLSVAYNMVAALRLTGELDAAALEGALGDIWNRHQALRTNFDLTDDRLWQRIRPVDETGGDFKMTRIGAGSEAAALAALDADANRPFDLSRDRLLRALLIRQGERRHLFQVTVHHIVSDAWSMAVIARELVHFYGCRRRREKPALPPLAIHYRDFTAWQENLEARGGLRLQRDYWLKKLADAGPPVALPADHPRPAVGGGQSDLVRVTIPLERLRRFDDPGRGTGPFPVLVAAVKALLFRYTGREDLVVGCVHAGRNHPDLEGQVGFFVNTLALRDSIRPTDSFASLLRRVRTTVEEAHAHADYPFDAVREGLARQGGGAPPPLFGVMIDFQVDRQPAAVLSGLTIEPFLGRRPAAKFDLLFLFIEKTTGLELIIEYDADLYQRRRIETAGHHLQTLLTAVGDDAEGLLLQIPLEADSGGTAATTTDALERFDLSEGP